MDFRLTADQLELQAAARDFARGELPLIAAELERDNTPPSHELIKRYADMGFLGINVPAALGGLGLGNIEALVVLEEFAKISSAVAFPIFESSVGPVRAIEHFAPAALRDRVVPAVCRGETVVAVSMSEPDAGSALTDLKTKGVVNGDNVVINGTKRWCSGGGHSDAYLVYCRLSDDPGAKAIGAVLVEKGTPGLSFGLNESLMGFRGIPSSDLNFDDCAVPVGNIVVPAGGFRQLMEAFDLERCGNATMALGQASGALEDLKGYVLERKQFGKPIAEFQAVQIKLAEMQMKVDAARLLIWRAAANAEDGLPSVLESSMGKCFANTIAREVTGDAVQLMGAYGYSREFPMERRLRDSWGWGIAGDGRPPLRPAPLMTQGVRIAALADLAASGATPVEVGALSLLVCRSGAGTFVIENRCSHQLAKLEGGKVKGPHIFCPLHGVRFDLRTGAPNGTLTKQPITVFASSVADDAVYAELPG